MQQVNHLGLCVGVAFLALVSSASAPAQVITSAEYYIDVDPGEGNGLPVNATDGAFNSANEQLMIPDVPTDDLTVGPHQLYVRAQDNLGNWGSPFVILFEVAGTHDIVSADYAIDGGTPQPLPVLMGDDAQYLLRSGDISTDDLTEGEHEIVTRVFDDRGTSASSVTWVNVWYPPTILRVEYQVCLFDTPGSSWLTTTTADDGAFDGTLESFTSALYDTHDLAQQDNYYVFVRAVDSRGRHGDESQAQEVTLNVFPIDSVGTVVVNPTPATASWSFLDGVQGTHYGTGPATLTGIPAGYITLTWGAICNLDPPQPNPRSQTLIPNATVTFTGVFTPSGEVFSVDFAANPAWGKPPMAVQFTGRVFGDQQVLDWRWDFGDGTIVEGDEPNPTHVYTNERFYTVSLTATTLCDSATATKQNLILVSQSLSVSRATFLGALVAILMLLGILLLHEHHHIKRAVGG